MKRDSICIILCLLALNSCTKLNNDFIHRHKTKKINLKGLKNETKIGYETDTAIIYFGLEDIIQLNKDLLSSKGFDQRWNHQIINDFNRNLDFLNEIKDDLIVQHWQIKNEYKDQRLYDLSGFIDQWVFKKLIFSGKAEVWNKAGQKFETEIIYHFVKDRLGGETALYTFEDGKEFHHQMITLGE